MVTEGEHQPDWTGATLRLPRLVVPAGSTCALFVHSTENHDRGIAYQSFRSYDEKILDDGTIAVFPGQARIGTDAFVTDDELRRWGWHRGPRGLAGGIIYESVRRRWSSETHLLFPLPFKAAVETVLLCGRREDCVLCCLPFEITLLLLGCLDWRDWPCVETEGRTAARRTRSAESAFKEGLFEQGWGNEHDSDGDSWEP
jgi:hypothetical protein